MKKILTAMILMALTGLGLVAVSEAPASAACPYNACIATTTTVTVPGKVRAQHAVPIRVVVTAPGNAIPTGKVHVLVIKSNGKIKYDSTLPYSGGTLTFTSPGLRHGYYTATATFTPATDSRGLSIYSGSSGSAGFHVKKNRHHRH